MARPTVKDYTSKFIHNKPWIEDGDPSYHAMINEVNSLGYRAPEFDTVDWKESIVAFGDSTTFGIGLDIEETWAHKLSVLTNRPVINMGVPAGSNKISLYNQMALAEIEKPYAVVNNWTSTYRDVLWTGTEPIPHNIGAWSLDVPGMPKHYKEQLNAYFDLITAPKQRYNTQALIYRTSQMLWKNTKYVEFTFFDDARDFFEVPFVKFVDTAYDESHPGPYTTTNTAKFILENL